MVNPVKSLQLSLQWRLKNLPLRVVLVVPFVVQICVAVAVVGGISFRNGQQAIGDLANRLSSEIGDHVSDRLREYLQTPKEINQLNVDAVDLGILNLKDLSITGHWFWKQIKLYNVGYINFAFDNQEFVGVERRDDGRFLINETTLARGLQKTAVFSTDALGNRQNLEDVVVGTEDVRQEAWYADAVKAGKPTWTRIYQWVDQPDVLSISHSYPLYDRDRRLIGVLGVDHILTQINEFLRKINPDPAARIFIIERSGLVVGTSSSERTFSIINGKPQRLNILNSRDQISKDIARYLTSQFGSFDSITGTEELEVDLSIGKQFIQVQSWRDPDGLDWLIVVILPESAFMERIYDRNRITILFSVAALAISILIGMITSRSITSPLLNLSGASQAIANGELDSRVMVRGTSEIKVLSQSFNRMAEMLTESFNRLEKANAELELRVQQRTSELADSQLSLQRNNFLLLRREQQMRKQQQVLIEITKNKSLNLGDFMLAVQDITESASQTLDVERVSIWLFDASKTSLNCLDLYVRSENLHTEAEMLNAENMPVFFNELQNKKGFVVEDLQDEPYLAEIERIYFRPMGIVSVVVSSFDIRGDLMGLLMLEHVGVERLWLIEEIGFVSSLADLLTLGMEAQERRRAEEGLRIEQIRSERLLLNVLPKVIADRLKSSTIYNAKSSVNKLWNANSQLHHNSKIIADTFDEVSVLFADIVSFTEFASLVSAADLVDMLNAIFSEFDRLVDQYELEKIKTIGDSYMVVGGLPLPRPDHAQAIANIALEMLKVINRFKRPDGKTFQLRIGIHTGQAVAGVIGKKKFIYDLWGDTVNIASRMESNGLPDCIQVTDVTYQILKDLYLFEQRGSIHVKGKGDMITYWLTGKHL